MSAPQPPRLAPRPRPLDWSIDPRRLLDAWPTDRALAVLWSAPPDPSTPAAARWSRWTILAAPDPASSLCCEPVPSGDPLAPLAAAAAGLVRPDDAEDTPDLPPFRGGWIVALAYGLGRDIEPRAAHPRSTINAPHPWPALTMLRCPVALAHDRLTGRWWQVGDPRHAHTLPTERELHAPAPAHAPDAFAMDWPAASLAPAARRRYERSVARVVEYIRAGDVFQANIAHQLTAGFSGSMRAGFAALLDRAAPWFGAYLELPAQGPDRQALASVSPELFLDFDPVSRTVITRPIKGTRPVEHGAAALASSPKDHAELAMIVDLMRNDLGRVCEFGSVAVPEARAIERHARAPQRDGGVLHGVATVHGRLRPGLGITDLLRATFPGGSVTGAPKIRAMQIIDELEPRPRGPYTGAIGYLSDCGRACLNIAIRTAHLRGRADPASAAVDQIAPGTGTWGYPVGAGIVADSDPAMEWMETLAKARPVLALAAPATEQACPTPAIA